MGATATTAPLRKPLARMHAEPCHPVRHIQSPVVPRKTRSVRHCLYFQAAAAETTGATIRPIDRHSTHLTFRTPTGTPRPATTPRRSSTGWKSPHRPGAAHHVVRGRVPAQAQTNPDLTRYIRISRYDRTADRAIIVAPPTGEVVVLPSIGCYLGDT